VANSFEENDCENANTRTQGGDHLLVLVLFVEVKRLFFTTSVA
jgi:hypothetical protein